MPKSSSTKKPVVNKNSKSIVVKKSTVAKKATTPTKKVVVTLHTKPKTNVTKKPIAAKSAMITKKTTVKPAVSIDNTKKEIIIEASNKVQEIKKVETPVVATSKTDTVVAPVVAPIVYSRFNPYLGNPKKAMTKNTKILLNITKYTIALALLVFGLLSLYFVTKWQALEGSGFLANLGIFSKTAINLPTGDAWAAIVSTTSQGLINEINQFAPSVFGLALYEISTFSRTMMDALMIFAILGLVSIIPLLIFKNATAWSATMLIMSGTFLIVVIFLFALGMAAQQAFVLPYRELSNQLSIYSSTKDLNFAQQGVQEALQKLLDALKAI